MIETVKITVGKTTAEWYSEHDRNTHKVDVTQVKELINATADAEVLRVRASRFGDD